MSKLDNRVAVVTGGSSGVGKAVAGLFLHAGARVTIAGRDSAKLAAAAEELAGGDRLATHPVDVADPKQCQQLIAAATQRFGKVDLLVNNAGMNIKQRTFRELTPEAWSMIVRANLDGAFYCTQAVLPQMLARKDGIVINIVSVAGKRANPLGGVAYVASKFGMGAMGTVLANEERENGIRVSNIYPGEINTPILEQRPRPVTEEQRANILQPGDVAEAVLFVATLPPHVSVPELIIKPTIHTYW
jgi:NADP-dependent 3-hydroxy acid dehydrogenase YdfG